MFGARSDKVKSARGVGGSAGSRERGPGARVAGLRAELERALRELSRASAALAASGGAVPSAVELEHARDADRDAKLAPWFEVREAHDKVSTLLTVIERVKFPPKPPRAPREPRPERFSSR
jgi:hypothetical protein